MMAARRKNRDFTAKDLVLTALMTAIVFLATFVPHIPIPLGYAHLGDAAIFLFALLTPRRSVLFAACFGSALADFMSGFALWIVPTLVIKFVMAEIVCRMAQARSGLWRIAAALALASLWMAAAYTARRCCPLRQPRGGAGLLPGASRGRRRQQRLGARRPAVFARAFFAQGLNLMDEERSDGIARSQGL